MRTRRDSSVYGLLLLFIAGCTTPVAGSLDEGQANRVLVALDRAGVGSDKEVDPASEGKFRVVVLRDDAPRAFTALREEELPASASPGLLDAFGKGGLMPSQLAEHAQWVSGLSGELEHTLDSIDGVLSARVHLSLPPAEPFSDAPRPKATASVLVKHRGATPPVEASAIRRLVSGAVPALSPDDVSIVLVGRPVPSAHAEQMLARFGPLWVTRGSLGVIRLSVAAALLVTLALLGTVLLLWSRLRKAQAAARANGSLEHAPPNG